MTEASDIRTLARRSVKVGGFFDRHPILTPAMVLSAAWLPYVVIFFRKHIAFGDLGASFPADSAAYWALLALQLVVCVISHSLAVRTIVRLFAPLWLIWGSIAFFALCPMWGMLTAADVRYPLFAMMICVITSAAAFIAYSPKPKKWLWAELAAASCLVCWLRGTGMWSVAPLLVALAALQFARYKEATKPTHVISSDIDTSVPTHVISSEVSEADEVEKSCCSSKKSNLYKNIKPAIAVIAVVSAAIALSACVGLALPVGEPAYFAQTDDAAGLTDQTLVAGVLRFGDVMAQSAFADAADAASHAIFAFQTAPVANLLFLTVPYAVLYAAFVIVAIVRNDARAIIVGMPQIAILAVMLFDPSKATLSFMLPVLAAQIMFFGAVLRGTDVIGEVSR